MPIWVNKLSRAGRGALRTLVAARRARRVAGIAAVLVAGLLLLRLQLGAVDSTAARLAVTTVELATVQQIDAGWEAALAAARGGRAHDADAIAGDAERLLGAIDRAAAATAETLPPHVLAELRGVYQEKAQWMQRAQRAGTDAAAALAAALRADAAVTALVRKYWPSFPQRERLLAAETLAVRVTAEAQSYHRRPSETARASLESLAADLTRTRALPDALRTGLARLESDVHQLLLLKPLEQALLDRLAASDATRRLDALQGTVRQSLNDALVRQHRYGIALGLYAASLLLVCGLLAFRWYRRQRDLEELYQRRTRELALTLHRVKDLEERALRRDERRTTAASRRTVRPLVEHDL